MDTVMRSGRFLLTCKYFRFPQIRNASLQYPVLNMRNIKKPKNVEEIPGIEKLWAKYRTMKIYENEFKKQELDELLKESLGNKSYETMHYFEKIFIVETSIGSLMKQNLVPSVDSVVNAFLNLLETFPFDSDKITQNEDAISIKHIRNAVEKQYLAWKFQQDLENLEVILHRYKLCLYEFRSLGNLRRNIKLLGKVSESSKLSVVEKIYHLNQKPFQANSIADFQDTIAGLNWRLFPRYCPRILKHSHQYILFIISALREMNFTEKQIQNGLPFLHYSFENFIRRLDHILTNPRLAKYKDDDKFFYLLSYHANVLQDLVNLRQASFAELTDLVSISANSLTGRVKLNTTKSIMYHVNQFYGIKSSFANIIKRHPKYKLVSEKQVFETVMFLKNKNFSENELAESLTIVLYPRKVIEQVLKQIDLEAPTLEKYGFKNGCVPQETHNFQNGTREKQKILQLCLYYLEKPYHFSGDGIWDYKDSSEVDTVAE